MEGSKEGIEGDLLWNRYPNNYSFITQVAYTQSQTLDSGEVIEGGLIQNIVPIDTDSVRVQYIDDNGNKLTKDKLISGTRGTSYDVSEDGSTVIFHYKRIKNSVLVRYQNENGEPIHESKVLVGKEGDSYDVAGPDYQLSISGYELDKTKITENVKGTIISPRIFVTYTYKKLTVTPEGYFEVPKIISLHALQENNKAIAGGKGTIKYHSVENEIDRKIKLFTDPVASLSTTKKYTQ